MRRRDQQRRWSALAVLAAGVVVFVVVVLAWPRPGRLLHQQYGVTFSQPHATGIGLHWQQTYDAILDDLGVKLLRLVANWDVIEPHDDHYDFSTIDYQMDQAAEHGAAVILAIGRKLPRWPECHTPAWAKELSEDKQQQQVLHMLVVVINRYKDHPALRMWQLENEPLLDFGQCPPEDRRFLAAEQDLIRSLDKQHGILVTDSGELNSWLPAAQYGDLLGTTMYRTVFSKRTHRPFHYDYIFPAWLYRLKAGYVDLLRHKSVIISELQGEPWGDRPWPVMSAAERTAVFSPERFRSIQRFAERTQLPEAYWWGVEYWYWEKTVQGNDTYWEIAREFF